MWLSAFRSFNRHFWQMTDHPERSAAQELQPYYEDEAVRIFHGDAREILPLFWMLPRFAIVTDPIWPNPGKLQLQGVDDPKGLLRETCASITDAPGLTRLIVHLGNDSDPRCLAGVVPESLPFLRAIWLRFTVPSYKGRNLNGAEIAYAFGKWPKVQPGRFVVSGESPVMDVEFTEFDTAAGRHRGKFATGDHPCPRRLTHLQWLIGVWTDEDEVVIDPFMGSGTTIVAAKYGGRKAVDIEIEERFCALAVSRLQQRVFDFNG
jgi:site-specific DNA-methyltransferase (adenine-specific)/modification methylase